ncbi:phosphate/phosphite/phosphonate ABC transporter substrate-binding protein [Pseudobacteriovorax antillogorgiicola]|uniref:Phosphonate transport system substrate-binding protein n=1 Tax=Pseudobacteriovorax antillogorgiicola TaxID=1513793 RepID=A0A1Y6BH94_9BACT|nr:phosphate/phosphite/phosphonate ABC transporter substrate-binding protein [Pseudobacteriovorax antillogorgiicola]TCS57416.1 phosphonate transport system substrate-binding protein [Pseudobacteriovorax antillogorgiicola]SMF01407.1 phosphonate transport system substrate-binding protein [Pseudobacteriovorax antillogorgiicola]
MRLIFVLAILGFNFSAESRTISFGIVPQQSASTLAEKWLPICKILSEQTGLAITFKTAPDIPTFERRLAEGAYDLAYMNPYHFVTFHKTPGYQALAKAKAKRIKGILVTRKSSHVHSLTDLQGARLAFPSPAAFAASILPRSELAQQKISFSPHYVSSHDSVYRAVAKGLFPAGGGVIRTFNTIDPTIREHLRIVWTTKPYTPHAIAVRPDMSDSVRTKLQNALQALDTSPKGRDALSSISIKGFEVAHNEDWDDVRALAITEIKQ